MIQSITQPFLKNFLIGLLLLSPLNSFAQDKVLFVRGGAGTVGFLEGGSDEQGASIYNFLNTGSNHGWGELGAALIAEGFAIEEISEDSPTPDSAVALESLPLSNYKVIVFGSNNATYQTNRVNALRTYIEGGGAALFVSDANFGQTWQDASNSDNNLLAAYGITMNQDFGVYTVTRAGEFLVPNHPIFAGVNSFAGEGVSPGTVSNSANASNPIILSKIPDGFTLRRNLATGAGPIGSSTSSDGTLIVATPGIGRIALHFDRNTFFNLNGAGTSINQFDNEEYARNLFNWLAGKATGGLYAPRAHFPDIPIGSTLSPGDLIRVIARDPDGTVSKVALLIDGQLISEITNGNYSWTLPSGLSPGAHTLTARVTDNNNLVTNAPLNFFFPAPGDIQPVLPRNNWVLSSNRQPGDLGFAIDGNLNTRWTTVQTQQAGQLFQIDLGSRQLFERIFIESQNNPEDYARGYVVRGSDDGINYTTLKTGVGTNPNTNIVLSRPVTYRYLQIEQTGQSPDRWWSIHEINLFAPSPSAALPLASWQQRYFPTRAPVTGTPSGDRSINLTFRRWIRDNKLIYKIEASNDLTNWSLVLGSLTEVGTPIPNQNGTETVTMRAVFPAPSGNGFLRLRVTQQP
jgi:hypothetical protein